MALPINIDELIHAQVVESERIEFKRGWNKEAVVHTICAFANDFHNWGGGYIIIGIAEVDGVPVLPPVGLETSQIDKIQKELLDICNHALRPVYTPIVQPVVYQEKHILIIWVPGGQHRPYKAKKYLTSVCKEYLPYIRKFANNAVALNEDEHELYSLASKIPFDDCMNRKAKITDLKLSLIQSFLADINSDLLTESSNLEFSKLCQSIQIIDGVAEEYCPRNVGLLFFNDKPQQFFPYCQIDVVQFMATTRDGDSLQEKIFHGPVQQQIRDVLNYLKNMILQEQVIKLPYQAEAIRYFNYPFTALEEAVVNAVYHRDYQLREPIEISVFTDRIEILSFPGPDRSIKYADLQHGQVVSRRYRNRRIGEFLKELKFTEGRSTGLPKIKRACKKNGSPEPIFDTNVEHDYFLTILNIHQGFLTSSDIGSDIGSDISSDISSDKILALIKKDAKTSATKIAKELGVTSRAVEKQLAKLKKNNKIRHVGSKIAGFWQIIDDEN